MQTVGDRVQETSETSGTGTLDLEGAVAGHRTFVAEIGDGNTCHYLIEHRNGSEWELGIGTVTDAPTDTLSRDTVLKSSNGDAKVDLSGGTKDVACTMPSGRAVLTDIKPTFSVDVDLGSNSLLNASIAAPLIDSGELADARLSSNVGLLDAAQTYTGAKTFDPGPVVIGADPGGTEILRVGGTVRVAADVVSEDQVYAKGAASSPTASPGTVAVQRSDNNPFVSWHHSDGTRVGYIQYRAGSLVRIRAQENVPMVFDTNDTERVRIAADGKVGIGTESPSAPLEVVRGSTTLGDPVVTFTSGGGRGISLLQPDTSSGPFVWSTGNAVSWEVDGTRSMFLNASGFVGVGGGVSPGFPFHVAGGNYAHLGAPASGPTTGDMDNGSVIFSVDETNNELDVTVRYSDGTVKTGTVSLS